MDIAELLAGDAPVKDMRGLPISPGEAAALLEGAGWLVLRADCSAVADKDSLFAAFSAALGREYFASNWDGFTDALCSLPYEETGRPGYAVLLENYADIFAGDKAALGAFLESLSDARTSLAGNHGVRLAVLGFCPPPTP
ncbi:MAG: barstar family protein [Elusimicrobiales bacterium]|nr:barstar family protein [Elusimicrobiales bacterium]